MPVTAVAVGSSPLVDALREAAGNGMHTVEGGTPTRQAQWLAMHPVPSGQHGIVFAAASAPWLPVSQAGWLVYWCQPSPPPVGTQALPAPALRSTVDGLVKQFWNMTVDDTRTVENVMRGETRRAGLVLFVTSASGGVGKSASCRRLAERAMSQGVSTVLVDGNVRQSSQRGFFDPAKTRRLNTVFEWRGGDPRTAANRGAQLGVKYDVVFAPPTGDDIEWSVMGDYVQACRSAWDFTIVDMDRVSVVDFDDPHTAASGMLKPAVLNHEARVLLIVKAGYQTQADALNVYERFASLGFPSQRVAVKDSIPVGMRQSEYKPLDYSRFGVDLGVEFQSENTGKLLAASVSNFTDAGLDHAREATLDWLFPDKGFNPKRCKLKQKGWRL